VSLGDWLDERTGWRGPFRRFANTPIPGGARWSYVFGGLLAFALLLQAVTGVLLASYYAPSATTAWASVAYLQQEVTLGWLIRGLHSAGASLMVLLLGMHLLQVTVWGAYRRPREVTWWLGLLMLGLVLAFALTGYLLPWDQKGYWATQVATSLVGELPLVGGFVRPLIQGGDEYGNLTLTHFYALHTLLLPTLLLGAAVCHVVLVRRHGVSNPTATPVTEPFWPRQAARDAVAMALMVAWLFAVVVRTHGAPLEAPADPSAAYDARPEWYFLPLFQLLKYLPGRLEGLGAIGVPLAIVALLALVPLKASPRVATVLVSTLIAAAVVLGVRARLEDDKNPQYRRGRARAAAEAARALALARSGVPPAGGTAVFANDPAIRARTLYQERCAGCHVLDDGGDARGPLLTAWSSRAWLTDFLANPDAPRYFGRTKKLHQMKPVKPTGDELAALVEFVYSQGGGDFNRARADQGQQIFRRENCDDCHATDGKSEGDGAPNLAGRGDDAWLREVIRDAGRGLWFGDHNEMPRFGPDKLSDADVAALVQLLRAERARTDVTAAQLATVR
jgi:ubiquinol-cytochrome c reductase cytochrome b subunit